jgi:hypothetical protein
MLSRRIIVDFVTTDTSDIAPVHDHFAYVVNDMLPGFSEIHLKVGKKIAARHKAVGVRQTARFRLTFAQMALPADGDDLLGVLGMLPGE